MIRRNITRTLLAALADTPVVLLHGARQTGKTTLVRALAEGDHPARYMTLDHPIVLAAARSDPQGFVDGLSGAVVIDEVQRAPDLALAIKAAVDRDRSPGRFLLTGSANALHVPRLADSLAGRMEIQTLWPFSAGELAGRQEGFVDRLFSPAPAVLDAPSATEGPPLLERLVAGGYPEAIGRPDADRRWAWFAAYVDTILQRDVRDLANVEGLTLMPRLLALLASRSGALLNYSDLARGMRLPQTTLKRYLALLEATFLVHTVPPWSSNLGQRLVKSPRVYLSDTGLLLYLLRTDRTRLATDPTLLGHVLETFVVGELRRQATWSRSRASLFHYRTHAGVEVDAVLEGPGGQLVGIEIKAAATIGRSEFKGLRHLAETLGDQFCRGVLLHCGTESVSFGPKLQALPLQALWA